MRRALLLLAVACSSRGKNKIDDCAIVRDKPASAMAELSSRYPNDPVKVAQTIESCVAPSGDECDRIAKIVAAMPSLAPQLAVPKPFDYAKTCRDAPAEFRRCLLPSYTLAHEAECKNLMTKPITEIEIKPAGPGHATAGDDCGFVAIFIDADGMWLATGRDDKARCYAPRKRGALDTDWLEAQLRRVKAHPCGPSSAELAAADDVSYQDVIHAMDVAVKSGFMDTGLAAPGELSVPLATARAKGAASECPVTLIAAEPAQAASPSTTPPPPRPPSSGDKLASAPVLVITRDALTLNVGTTSTEIAKVAAAQSAAKLDALTKALPKTTDGLLILQADERTPSKLINLVVTTAKTAGYDNVLFAVKNK